MSRFYDRRLWRDRIRPNQLAREPLCRHCKALGLIVLATQVDHVIPIEAGGDDRDDRNVQSLCDACHCRKTRRDGGAVVGTAFDVDGNPIDTDHHWNSTP